MKSAMSTRHGETSNWRRNDFRWEKNCQLVAFAPWRRYFRLTNLGEQVAIAEAKRLEAAVVEARARRLLAKRG
jgi:hypothetical protein